VNTTRWPPGLEVTCGGTGAGSRAVLVPAERVANRIGPGWLRACREPAGLTAGACG